MKRVCRDSGLEEWFGGVEGVGRERKIAKGRDLIMDFHKFRDLGRER